MCKAGKVQEAYDLIKADLTANPTNLWTQRGMAWALYYMIKNDVEAGDYGKLLEHIDELKSLDRLTTDGDQIIFNNIQLKIAEFVNNHVSLNDTESLAKLSKLFLKLKDYDFKASIGHSSLLRSFIKFEAWPMMADFIDWWNLDNLTQEDFTPFINQKGMKMMTLAERAYIAYSKALLKLDDAGRTEDFLPKLNSLINTHEEMMYPGYFYGKLLLSLGGDADEALKVVIPFARKKSSEFWVWQLLSDVFTHDEEKQLACLLRAVHCRTQESFLGKVRIKLAALYIRKNQLSRARYHIDMAARCYASQGWRLPHELDAWIHQQWWKTTLPDTSDPIDYKTITDDILCDGAEECIAVVTYVDEKSRKCSMVYGLNQRISTKLRFKVSAGNVLKLRFITDKDSKMKVLSAEKVQLPANLDYAKFVDGTIIRNNDKEFAFLKSGSLKCFVSPIVVNKYNLKNKDNVRGLIVNDYDRKKELWNWVCVYINK